MSDDFLNLDYAKIIKKITAFISDQVRSRKKNGGDIDRIFEFYLQKHLNNCEVSKRKINLVTDMIAKTEHKKEKIPICNPFLA
jgi:hypothetical protein